METHLAGTVFRSYEAVPDEADEFLRITEGGIPKGLRGVLYRNGSGRMERGGNYYGHPFDGDGMISRFAFTDQGIHYRNRFVRTRWFLEEEAAGQILYRNFGTNRPGGFHRNMFRLRFKNAANTNVIYHGGKLLALWEGGLPHQLHPESLNTIGAFTYEGALLSPTSLMGRVVGPELPFSAHPRFDPATGDLYNFGIAMGLKPVLMLYRVDSSGRLYRLDSVRLDAMGFMHDFALTQNWFVFFFCPLTFDLVQMILGLKPVMCCAAFAERRSTQVILVPRKGGSPVKLSSAPCFVFHFSNAFEDKEGRIVVDGPRYGRFPAVEPFAELPRKGFGDFPKMLLTRFTIDLKKRSVLEEELSGCPAELPRANPLKSGEHYRYIWASATSTDWPPSRSNFGILER
jgi:all-trans-8'-apo-beta-carotenal 15,15'-oxygenase